MSERSHADFIASLKPGDRVRLRCYGGEIREARVIHPRSNPRVVVICNEKEWQAAYAEDREPMGLGFPHADVLPLEEPKQ